MREPGLDGPAKKPPWTLMELREWMADKNIFWRYKSIEPGTPETKEPYIPIVDTIRESVEQAIKEWPAVQ